MPKKKYYYTVKRENETPLKSSIKIMIWLICGCTLMGVNQIISMSNKLSTTKN